MHRLASIAALLAFAGCVETDTSSVQQDVQEPEPHVNLRKDAGGGNASTGGNLIDHGGKVLAASHTVSIWWGNQSAFPTDAKTGIDSLFNGLNGSSLLGLANQYMRGPSATTSHATTDWTDTSSPPNKSPQVSAIVNEACKAIGANGQTPDSTAIYFVFTSNYPGGHVNYCAWHSHGTCNGVDIQVAYMPNLTGIAGCDPGNLYNCNSYSEGTRALASVTSHEYMEAITDPDLNAWYDNGGSEIGDKCAWQFASCVTLGSTQWQVQKEWSNATSSCVQD